MNNTLFNRIFLAPLHFLTNYDSKRTFVHPYRRGEPSFLSLLYGSFYPSIAVSQLESRATCKLVIGQYISFV